MINNKVAIYCRLSVEDIDKIKKGDDSESIQNQKMILTDYSAKEKWEVFKIYSDDDCSGLDSSRRGFNEMISQAEKGMFNIILCKTQSRFTRDMELVEKYIHGLFIEWGIRFVTAIDHVDTDIKGNKKTRQINGLINEWYCEDLSENIRAVFKRKMENGQFIGSFAPFGYMKDINERHKLVVDFEAAEIVRKIFDLYIEGNGAFKIAAILTGEGVPTPSAYKYSKGLNFKNPNSQKYSITYGIWAQNSVRRILQNPVYIGTLIQGMEKKISYKSKKIISVPKEDWIVVENNHEPIINGEIFLRVKKLIEGRRSVYKSLECHNNTNKEYIFSGIIFCLDCGAIMHRTAMSRDKSTYYIKCGANKKIKNCSPHSIRLDIVEKYVSESINKLLKSYIDDECSFSYIVEKLYKYDKIKTKIDSSEKKLFEIENKLLSLPEIITSAYKDKIKGIISESDFISIKNTLDCEREKYNNKRHLINEEIKIIKCVENYECNLKELIYDTINFKCLTFDMINEFIEYIQVGELDGEGKQEIIINWRF